MFKSARAVRLIALGTIVTAIAVAWKLRATHPSEWVPSCPTWSLAGVHCPGCGSTRSMHHLLNGRAQDAIRHNVLMVFIGVPAGLWYLIGRAREGVSGERESGIVWPGALGWTMLGVILVFAVVRNLPGERFEVLRPPPVVSPS